ncbi:V-type proton ATPase subunit G-like [Anthonomus grandis grandis]|uniref:V-type proton ATPase subunit G-like n=1 Tax=Anthonomus grandis grandis TaxID=2921223 RepID=UPI002164F61F|nr:V-type proton ATPase subunit G-like [Anthonomus grandis grandis]
MPSSANSHHHSPASNNQYAHQTPGIQQLLAAEKRAAEKVAEARKRKLRRVKQAREEAEAEIESLRIRKEQSFLQFEEEFLCNKEDIAQQIENNTENYLERMEKIFQKNKANVIDDLIDLVVENIKVEPNRNFYMLQMFKEI